MHDGKAQDRFPVVKAAGALLLAAVLLAPVAAWAAAMPQGAGDIFACVLTTVALVVGLAVISLLPMVWVGPRGVMAVAYAWFIAMLVRMPLCLGAVWIVKKAGWLAVPSLVACLAVYYVPVLLIEAAFVGRYLWRKDATKMTIDNDRLAAPPAPEVTA